MAKSDEFRLYVPGIPVPQPRVTVGKGRGYVPADHPIHAYRDAIGMFARAAWAGEPTSSPVRVATHFTVPKTKLDIRGRRIPYKADLDNLIKAAWDALEGVVFVNDSQVAECHASRIVGSDNPDECGTMILVKILA